MFKHGKPLNLRDLNIFVNEHEKINIKYYKCMVFIFY